MGYSHYWRRDRIIHPRVFDRIVDDFNRLSPEWARLDVCLAGPLGKGRMRISRQEIAFNGRIRCRHPAPSEASAFAYMLRVASLLSLPDGERETVSRQMWEEEHTQRRCPGNCAFETFWFPRVVPQRGDEAVWDRTKTAFRPYDVAVTSALLIARRHLGSALHIDSDGGEAQWWDARLLCQSVLGYGLKVKLGLRDE